MFKLKSKLKVLVAASLIFLLTACATGQNFNPANKSLNNQYETTDPKWQHKNPSETEEFIGGILETSVGLGFLVGAILMHV